MSVANVQTQHSRTKPSPTRISVPGTVAGENCTPATLKAAPGPSGGGGREGAQLRAASGAKGRGGGGGDGSGEKGSGGGGGEGSGEYGEGGGGGSSAAEAVIAPRGRRGARLDSCALNALGTAAEFRTGEPGQRNMAEDRVGPEQHITS